MGNLEHRPLLIVIAGPNGSGKTSVTKRLLQFRLVNGVMGKMYVTDVPEWAQAILPDTEFVRH